MRNAIRFASCINWASLNTTSISKKYFSFRSFFFILEDIVKHGCSFKKPSASEFLVRIVLPSNEGLGKSKHATYLTIIN